MKNFHFFIFWFILSWIIFFLFFSIFLKNDNSTIVEWSIWNNISLNKEESIIKKGLKPLLDYKENIIKYDWEINSYINLYIKSYHKDLNNVEYIDSNLKGSKEDLNKKFLSSSFDILDWYLWYNLSYETLYNLGTILSALNIWDKKIENCVEILNWKENLFEYFFDEENIKYKKLVDFPLSHKQKRAFVESLIFVYNLNSNDYKWLKDFCLNSKVYFCWKDTIELFNKNQKKDILKVIENSNDSSYINLFVQHIIDPIEKEELSKKICSLERYKEEK